MDVGRGLILLALFGLLPGAVAASSFEIDIVEYNQSVTEGDFLNVEANVSNSGTSGFQTVNISVNGDEKEILTKNISLNEGSYETIGFEYLVEAGDAQTDSSARVYTSSDSEEVQIDISTFETRLEEGWNYFSLPIATQKSYEISSIIPEEKIRSVWTYEDDRWVNYFPSAPENIFNSFKPGQGYLIDSESNITLRPKVDNTLDGSSGVQNSIPASNDLSKGWNLVGHYWEVSQNPNKAFGSIGSEIGEVYKQSRKGELGLESTDALKPGSAYWMHVDVNSSYARSEYTPRSYEERQVEKLGELPRLMYRIDGVDNVFSPSIINGRKNEINVTPLERLGRGQTVNITEYLSESKLKVVVRNKSEVVRECEGRPDDDLGLECDLKIENYVVGDEYTIMYGIKRIGQDDYSFNQRTVEVKEPEINDLRTSYTQNIVDGTVMEDNLGELNLSYDPYSYGGNRREFINSTEFKRQATANIFIKKSTRSNDRYSGGDSEVDLSGYTKVCESGANELGYIRCDLNRSSFSIGDYYVYANVTTDGDYQGERSNIRIENLEVPPLEFEFENAFRFGEGLVYEESPGLLKVNLSSSDLDEPEFFNTTQFNRRVEAEFYVNNHTEDDGHVSDGYVCFSECLERGEDKEYVNLTNYTKICSVESTGTSLKCNLEGKGLEFPQRYDYYVNISTENNTYWGSTVGEFRVGKKKSIGDTVETKSLRYVLDYFKGNLDDSNKDIRNIETSQTLRNKNISVEQSFDGIGVSSEFFTKSGISENTQYIHAPEGLREGEADNEIDSGEMLASEKPSLLKVEFTGSEDYLGEVVYNVSSYSKNWSEIVPEERNYEIGQVAENEEITVNVTDVTNNSVNENEKDFGATIFLKNKNMNYTDDNETGIDLTMLNSDGERIDAEYPTIGGPDGVNLGTKEVSTRDNSILDELKPHYFLVEANYGGLGRSKPVFLFEINRSELTP